MSEPSRITIPERAVRIDVADAALPGDLTIPPDASGVVAFAHGSGSSRHSSRNRAVGAVLQQAGLATLLMDLLTAEEEAAFKQPILDKYAYESSAYYSTARMWDDGIIDPVDTRKVLALGIAASLNAPYPDNAFGVFRM